MDDCTSQGSACAGVRGELGWVTIQGEIMKRKIQYLGKLRNMSAGRWPREVWMIIKDHNVSSGWVKEVEDAMGKIGMVDNGQDFVKWRRELNSKIKKWEKASFRDEKEANSKLTWYPKATIGERAPYLDSTEPSKYFCKARLNDVGLLWESRCKVCDQEVSSWRDHVLLDCEAMQQLRKGNLWWNPLRSRGEQLWTILDHRTNVMAVYKLIKAWERECLRKGTDRS